ncbi:MAG: hypothetical protein LBV75_09270 [Paludibacter sp.]|nr:hypothetical protein [Paludibacter sp.]
MNKDNADISNLKSSSKFSFITLADCNPKILNGNNHKISIFIINYWLANANRKINLPIQKYTQNVRKYSQTALPTWL